MSSLLNAFAQHENMRIGNFNEKNMLIAFESDQVEEVAPPSIGEASLLVQVSYDKDSSAEIGPAPSFQLLSIKNLVDDTPMGIKSTPLTTVTISAEIERNNRKGLAMNYCGVYKDIGSYADGIYNHLSVFGATSCCVFTRYQRTVNPGIWSKLSSAGVDGGFFGISRFGGTDKLVLQFNGQSYGSVVGEFIPFSWNDTATDIAYLAYGSVKEFGVVAGNLKTYELHLELHSFTDQVSDPVFVSEVTFYRDFDLTTSSARFKDYYHSGLDKYTIDTNLNWSGLRVFESRYYLGCIEGEARTYIINDLLNYYRGFDGPPVVVLQQPTEYTINYQFSETIGDLTLNTGIVEYHQSRMIKLQPGQQLTKVFANNSVLTAGQNLNLLTIRVKVFGVNWRVGGHGSWSFEFHNGELKFTDGTTDVLSSVSLITLFNDFTCVVNPQTIYFYVNGLLHESKNNTITMPLTTWDTLEINKSINGLNFYNLVQIKLGVEDSSTMIYDDYNGNKTDFFLHLSLTASHVLNVDRNFYTTLSTGYIAEPQAYLSSRSQTEFVTPNTTNDGGESSMITIPNTQNRTFNLTYNFTDGTSLTKAITSTLFDPNEPNKSNSSIPPNLSAFEYLIENKYRVMFHLNTITQGFAVPVKEVDFSYNPDARLSGGEFTTTVHPITTVAKANQQKITINDYAGSFIPLGYYDFDVSDRNVKTFNEPSTLIKNIITYYYSSLGTNIVNTNVKTISRYRQPYLRFISRQDRTRREQISRYLVFEKQDYTNAITSIVINLHVKTTNLTIGDLFPDNSTVLTTSAPVKTGYDVNQQHTFTFTTPQTNLQGVFALIANQTTQMVYPSDFYLELLQINGVLLPYPTSVYIEPISYIPTLRFSYTATQENFEERINIIVNKNEDNITGFRIRVKHQYDATILYNDFGVPGITTTSTSEYFTIFTFAGTHFASQNETLIQLIIAGSTSFDKIFDSEIQITIESLTLASSAVILDNPVIKPTFTFTSLSLVMLADYSFETIDDYIETVSMNVYLKTNRDVKTALSFWISLEDSSLTGGNASIAGSQVYAIDKALWDFTIVPQQRNFFGAVTANGYTFTATKLPQISSESSQLRLLTISYRRYREFEFRPFNLYALIDTISPSTNLLPFPDTSNNQNTPKLRETELKVRPISASGIININIDLLITKFTRTYDVALEIWYDNSKLTYTSVIGSLPEIFQTITVTPISGTYEGFTQGQLINMVAPPAPGQVNVGGLYQENSIFDLLQIQLTPNNSYTAITNDDFAVKFVSHQLAYENDVLIQNTTIPPFDYQVDVSITGSISTLEEGVSYNFITTLNQPTGYALFIVYDILFNGSVLTSDSPSYDEPFGTWGPTKKISTSFYETSSSSATHTERFEMKFYREGLSDSDFEIVIRSIEPRNTFPSTLTLNSVTSITSFTYTPEFQLRLSPAVVGDTITVTVILEKDSRAIRYVDFNILADDDRTINYTLPRLQLLQTGTYTVTYQLNTDLSASGGYTNTNKTLVQYYATSPGVGNGIVNLPLYSFTVKRRQVNYLITNNDYVGEFVTYEPFHTSTPYYDLQFNADRDTIPYIRPQIYLSNVVVSTLSTNNHRLSFTVNHPAVTPLTLQFRVFYRNMYINQSGTFVKTTVGGNPYNTEIGFINGQYDTRAVSSGNTTVITNDFQTDTLLTDHITQDDFLVVLLYPLGKTSIEYDIPTTNYTPSTYIEPSSYLLPIVSNTEVFEVSLTNEKNYFTFFGNNINTVRSGVKKFSDNVLLTVENGLQKSGELLIRSTANQTPDLQRTFSYDWVTNGAEGMLTSIFVMSSWDEGVTIKLIGLDDMLMLELVRQSGANPVPRGHLCLRFNGVLFDGSAEKIEINLNTIYAVRVRVVKKTSNTYDVTIKDWTTTESTPVVWTPRNDIVFSTIQQVSVNPSPAIAKICYSTGVGNFAIDYAYMKFEVGRFTNLQFNDEYFKDQLYSHIKADTTYAVLDLRRQQTEWETDWDTNEFYDIFGYLYTTIGESRAIGLYRDYLYKKTFSTGSALWNNTMRIGLIIVFRTGGSVDRQLSLFLHGKTRSPPNQQLIVNRNGTSDNISIELNENNGQLQQQQRDHLDWEKSGYEYLYYAKFYKRPNVAGSAYESYDIETRLIGLNNSTNETYTSVGSPQFLKSSPESSTNFSDRLFIGKSILEDSQYDGGFSVGYVNYFQFKSEIHSSYEIERVRRDWETIY